MEAKQRASLLEVVATVAAAPVATHTSPLFASTVPVTGSTERLYAYA